jgi:outer membrane protein assembly factor BamB
VKRLLISLLFVSLVITPVAHSAPKKITVKPMQFLTTIGTPDEVSGAVVSGKSIIVFGTKTSKAYARAIDVTGKELWNLSLDQSSSSIATAAAVDAAGDIWIAGATPLALGLITPTPTATPLNPDSAVIPPSTKVGNLQAVTIWKVSSTGTLLFTNTLPTSFVLFPTAIAVDKNGASVVGIIATSKGSAGFLTNVDPAGVFSKLLQLGATTTTADAVVRHADGSITIAGSSSETLVGKKVAGITDGILVKVSKSLKITSVVRSSVAKGKRIWNSASTSLLLAGEVVAAGKTESAVTKFSLSFAPSWTYRFASTGPTLSASSTQAFFISTGAIAQLNWNPKVPTPLLLTFDSKGVITAADSGPVGQKELLGLIISKEIGVLALTSSAESVSIFTLLPR